MISEHTRKTLKAYEVKDGDEIIAEELAKNPKGTTVSITGYEVEAVVDWQMFLTTLDYGTDTLTIGEVIFNARRQGHPLMRVKWMKKKNTMSSRSEICQIDRIVWNTVESMLTSPHTCPSN